MSKQRIGLVTGASRGLGLAVARALAATGWTLVIDGRNEEALGGAAREIGGEIVAVPGDIGDASHRAALARVVGRYGHLDLLVNNASVLGPSPQPALDRYPLNELDRVLRINTLAPLAIIQLLLPPLTAASGVVVNITSDAAVEPYPGWGGYGASKAALDQITAVLGAEQPGIRVYAFDPGDMRTQMHQEAFPGEDISDRPEPSTVVPALLVLIERRLPSGRYRAADVLAETGATT